MIKRFLAWLKSIYFKPAQAETQTPKEKIMSEPLADTVVEQPVVENVTAEVQPVVESAAEVAEVAAEPETTETDAVLAKLKELVAAAGAQSHAVFDDLVELAKKLI